VHIDLYPFSSAEFTQNYFSTPSRNLNLGMHKSLLQFCCKSALVKRLPKLFGPRLRQCDHPSADHVGFAHLGFALGLWGLMVTTKRIFWMRHHKQRGKGKFRFDWSEMFFQGDGTYPTVESNLDNPSST